MDFCELDFLNVDEEDLQPMQKKLLERYGRRIYAYVLEKTGSRDLTREITAGVFIELYNRIKASDTTDSLEILIKSMADSKINGLAYAEEDFEGVSKIVEAAMNGNALCENEAAGAENMTQDAAVKGEFVPSEVPVGKRSSRPDGHKKEKKRSGLAPGWIILIAAGAAVGTFIFATYLYSHGLESLFDSIKESMSNMPMMRLFQ